MLIGHYAELLRQYRGLVLAIALGIFAVATVAAVARLLLMPAYTATASVTVLPTSAELSYSRRFVSDGDGGSDPAAVMMQTHIENLFSRPVAELTLEHLSRGGGREGVAEPESEPGWLGRVARATLGGLRTLYQLVDTGSVAQAGPHDKAVAAIQKSIDVDWVQGSYILRISATATTPEMAARIANSVSQAYVERSRRVADEAAAAVRTYLEEEVARRQTRLDPEGVRDLRRRLVDVEMSRTAGIGQVRIIDPATVPLRPAHRVVPMSVGGAAAGVLIAVLVIVAVDTFSGTARTSMDMTRIVGRRFLGRVPTVLAQIGRQRPGNERLPLQPAARFATAICSRLATRSADPDRLWVHVVGMGGPQTARQGGIAIAAALASCDLPVEIILGPDERYYMRRDGGALMLQPLPEGEPLADGPLVSAGAPFTRRPPLLIDARENRSEPAEEGPETNDFGPAEFVARPLFVVAVAAGQVSEELIETMTAEGGPGECLFLLVS